LAKGLGIRSVARVFEADPTRRLAGWWRRQSTCKRLYAIFSIADIFEALTAKDRPYKKGKILMESLCILGFMKQEGHIDPELFDVFIREKVYLRYAEAYLNPEQIDDVVLSQSPGYAPQP
jgi:hypothetical protein